MSQFSDKGISRFFRLTKASFHAGFRFKSLPFVSTAGRGATPPGVAPAYFYSQDAGGNFEKPLAPSARRNTFASFFTPRPTRRKASGGVIFFRQGGFENAR